ncbi:MAG: hypothetical protein ABIN11_01565 [candidate division WOR-3 bacterium]
MKSFQILVFISLFNLNLFSEIFSYTIFKENKIVGYSNLEIYNSMIIERTLFIDGFSKEYNLSKTNIKENSFKCYKYYSDRALPERIESNNGILKKSFYDKLLKYKIKPYDFIGVENILTVSYLGGIKKDSVFNFNRNEFLNVKRNGNEYIFGFGAYSIFYKNGIIDSVYYFNYRYIKNDKIFEIKNPYSINVNRMYRPENFYKKKNRRFIELKYTNILLSYNDQRNTVVLITPFTFTSDMFGNISNSITPFTQLQISENLDIPTVIFEFKNKELNSVNIEKAINEIFDFLKRDFKKVYLLSFNHFFLYLNIENFDRVILINPPLKDIKIWAEDFYKKISFKNNYLFRNYEKFLKYEIVDTTMTFDEIELFYKKRSDFLFIFSKDILEKEDIDRTFELKGKVYFIKNVDRRLNSYYKYDLWSYENNLMIDKKIFSFLNDLIK